MSSLASPRRACPTSSGRGYSAKVRIPGQRFGSQAGRSEGRPALPDRAESASRPAEDRATQPPGQQRILLTVPRNGVARRRKELTVAALRRCHLQGSHHSRWGAQPSSAQAPGKPLTPPPPRCSGAALAPAQWVLGKGRGCSRSAQVEIAVEVLKLAFNVDFQYYSIYSSMNWMRE